MKSWKIFLAVLFFVLLVSLSYYLYPSMNYLSVSSPTHVTLLSPENKINELWYHWSESNFGDSYPLTASGFIIEAILFYVLGMAFPAKFAYFLFIFLVLAMGGCGFYAFLKEFIFSKRGNKSLLSTIGALFYASNIFVCIFLGRIELLLPYLLAPWVIYCLLKYLQYGKLKWLLLSSSLIALLAAQTNLPTVAIALLIIVWTFVTFSIIERHSLRKVLFSLGKVSIMSLLLSIWWLLPYLVYVLNHSSDISSSLGTEAFYSWNSSFLNVFHLSGAPFLLVEWFGRRIFYFSDVLLHLRWFLVLLAALLIAPLLYRRAATERSDRIWLLSFSGLLVIGYLLAQGYHDSSPIKSQYLWLMDHSIFFGTFRNNLKFVAIIAFVYSILLPYLYLALRHLARKERIWLLSLLALLVFGYLVAQYHDAFIIRHPYLWLVDRLKASATFETVFKLIAIVAFAISLPYLYLVLKRLATKRLVMGKLLDFLPIGVVLVTLLSFSYPLWTGTVYNHYSKGIPQETHNVSDLVSDRLEDKPGKMMILPGTWLSYYDWAFQATISPIFLSLMNNPEAIIYRYGGNTLLQRSRPLVDDLLYKEFFNLDNQALLNLGIKYILFDKTLDTRFPNTLPIRNMEVLEHYLNENFVGIYQNDKYTLYEIEGTPNEVFFVPLETRFLDTSDGNLTSLLKHVNTEEVVVVNTQMPNHEVPELEVYQPMLSLDMVDDSDGDFSYGCRTWIAEWIEESGDMDVTVFEDDVLANCSLHGNYSLCYIGKRFHNPVDLTEYDRVDIVVTPSYPVEDVVIQVELMDYNERWALLIPYPAPALELSDETPIEIPIDWNRVYHTGANPRKIQGIQIVISKRAKEEKDISLRINRTATFSSAQPIPKVTITDGSAPATVTGYRKINPALHKVDVVATEPFMLASNRAHDPLWVAKVNGKEYQSLSLYSAISGFWIEETGELEITIEYKPQRWFYYGIAISLASLTGALAYLVWDWRKRVWKQQARR